LDVSGLAGRRERAGQAALALEVARDAPGSCSTSSTTSTSVSGALGWRAHLEVRREALARRYEGAVEHERVEVKVEMESAARIPFVTTPSVVTLRRDPTNPGLPAARRARRRSVRSALLRSPRVRVALPQNEAAAHLPLQLGWPIVRQWTNLLVMQRINVHDAKTHLSHYLERVERGEVFTICRNNVPVAELRALPPVRSSPRKLGRHKGQVRIEPSFFQALDEADLSAWTRGRCASSRPSSMRWTKPT
jgi:antitoxin (DNA-binding transcriptional repressor) of toxin-antitoxin stability system